MGNSRSANSDVKNAYLKIPKEGRVFNASRMALAYFVPVNDNYIHEQLKTRRGSVVWLACSVGSGSGFA